MSAIVILAVALLLRLGSPMLYSLSSCNMYSTHWIQASGSRHCPGGALGTGDRDGARAVSIISAGVIVISVAWSARRGDAPAPEVSSPHTGVGEARGLEEEAADPHAVNRLESHVFIQRDAKVRGGGHDWYVWQAGRCAEVPVLEPRTRVSRRWSRD